jgi:hypothetical protein
VSRSAIRELIQRAQTAELGGQFDQAVGLLEEAASRALDQTDSGRAASLLRHCLRLAPSRADLAERLERLSSDPAAPRRSLDLPPRGPAPADPAADAWCSFCCRPKLEVGPVVAGPAGAFICASCIEAAARIATRDGAPQPAVAQELAAPAPGAPRADSEARDFIEAAVLLSRELGWSLQEIRSLSPDERQRAVELVRRQGTRINVTDFFEPRR